MTDLFAALLLNSDTLQDRNVKTGFSRASDDDKNSTEILPCILDTSSLRQEFSSLVELDNASDMLMDSCHNITTVHRLYILGNNRCAGLHWNHLYFHLPINQYKNY